MDGLELIAFTIISTVGTAKSNVMESMSLARSGKFEEAEEKNVELSLLFIHAEDQLMTTVCLRDVAVELIETNKKIACLSDTIDQLVEAQK
ncbi:PTS lactose/cellobiose transporter subunit IIA [Carnobacterium maltaromaticum]|uniref:PTS lactose/cellobiose transporter subunit IIA n=1 Tax=Carnobacterium maltaromaticum TaxID=2751 RepID=UPI00295E9BAC|nr:PTS lactose/cellobiose transporter subunit IIA [Carnobacterium maltaromaticum]